MKLAVVFFFQAEDGIRDKLVTGVQTCALPISLVDARELGAERRRPDDARVEHSGHAEVVHVRVLAGDLGGDVGARERFADDRVLRSEEHTSELQSLAYLVCRLLLEKKKKPLQLRRF